MLAFDARPRPCPRLIRVRVLAVEKLLSQDLASNDPDYQRLRQDPLHQRRQTGPQNRHGRHQVAVLPAVEDCGGMPFQRDGDGDTEGDKSQDRGFAGRNDPPAVRPDQGNDSECEQRG